ncbi:MAG: hypothetical protein ABH825_00630 [Candidatus Omnitrophota bacterium]
MMKNERIISNTVLVFVFISIVAYFVFLQFVSPTMYGVDAYYHIAVANFIKDFGPRYEFRWAQFSTFKEFFSDKEFLFHLPIIPFLYLIEDPVIAGKCAVVFYTVLLLLAYVFILKQYLHPFLAACFLMLPVFSTIFSIYLLYLRPGTLANILTILSIYCLIEKKWAMLFILSVLFTLSHISFFTVVIFALICEMIRYAVKKEFCIRNMYIPVIGILAGSFLHPNFPNNLLSLHLNGFVVPFHTAKGLDLCFGRELFATNTKDAFMSNFAIFMTINLALLMAFTAKIKVRLSTFIWWGCASAYFILAMSATRHWYPANLLVFIFFASFINDWVGDRPWRSVRRNINAAIIVYSVVAAVILVPNAKELENALAESVRGNITNENAGRWMKYNVPEGETIYHGFWSDAPALMCLNPKNNYIMVLDPIYMVYKYPIEFKAYIDLIRGIPKDPYNDLKNVLKVNYGYIRNGTWLYAHLKTEKPENFIILYEDYQSIIFKIT